MSSACATPPSDMKRTKLFGYDFYHSIGSPKFVVAPMVEQSELAFRLLTRRYGAQLAYSPMVNAKVFLTTRDHSYDKMINTCPEDRPYIIQFAGNDPETILAAAKRVEHMCDAVDLNVGCPQTIARRGNYGSFLLEKTELLVDIVKALHEGLSIPVTVKIRLLPTIEATIALAQALEAAGCSILTVHGRKRDEKKELSGACDWDGIKAVKAAVNIPVFANGGIGRLADVKRCLEYTGCDGVMSSEGVLENPGLFNNRWDPVREAYSTQVDMARQYLEYCRMYNPGKKSIQHHMFKFLFEWACSDAEIREGMVSPGRTIDDYAHCTELVAERYKDTVELSKWLGNDDLPLTPVLGPVNVGKREGGAAHGGLWYMRHPRFDYEKGNRMQEKTLAEKLDEARKRREARGAAAHPVRLDEKDMAVNVASIFGSAEESEF